MAKVSLPKNQIEILCALLNAKARFLVVGGYAFSAYAFIRATKDVDIWVDPDIDNARRVFKALAEYGAPLADHSITPEDFIAPNLIYQLGIQPQRIDILTAIADLDFAKCWQRRNEVDIDNIKVSVIGLEDLIYAKQYAGRKQDLLDVEALCRVAAGKSG